MREVNKGWYQEYQVIIFYVGTVSHKLLKVAPIKEKKKKRIKREVRFQKCILQVWER